MALVLTAPAPASDDLRAMEEAAMRTAVIEAAPSVVRIETLGGLQRVDGQVVTVGPTTGVIVSPDGLIVSSSFNFIHQPTSILVTLPDGQRAAAEIVARDHSRMLVLLKVPVTQPLKPATPAPRDAMRVGQWTIAVGRTFLPDEPNISVGVLSATHRIWGRALQTDAKISPSNYGGPLIDLQGRVLGILVPLSPQTEQERAGAEWYDSGIGFAVPLVDILDRLDVLSRGQDLHTGVLGIALKGGNEITDEPIIGAVRVKSPAAEAGLKVDDKIVSANGQPVARIAQLKHVLGTLYAGDAVTLQVERGEETLTMSATLVDKLLPYAHPFLGILPGRPLASQEQPPAAGVVVRMVYPASPAAEAGIEAGDRLLTWEGQPVQDAAACLQLQAQHEPGDTVTVSWSRGEQVLEAKVTLAGLPEEVPADVAPHAMPEMAFEGERPEVGRVTVKIPEVPNECFAWVPDNYDPRVRYGVVVWLHPAAQYDFDALENQWKALCAQRQLILLAPKAGNESGWRPTEVDFVRKTIEQIIDRYSIDRQRIVLHGSQAGGAMSFLAGFAHRDLVRGIAASEVALPSRLRVPDNEPLQRLAILTTVVEESRLAPSTKSGIEKLREMKYPVTVIPQTAPQPLDESQRALLVRWIDTLDRL